MISSEAAYRQYGSWSSHLDRRIVTTIADNTFNRRRARAMDGLGVTFLLGSFPGLVGLRYADNLGAQLGGEVERPKQAPVVSPLPLKVSAHPTRIRRFWRQTRDARQLIWVPNAVRSPPITARTSAPSTGLKPAIDSTTAVPPPASDDRTARSMST